MDPGARRAEVRTSPDAAAGSYRHTRLASPGERLEVDCVAVADLFGGPR